VQPKNRQRSPLRARANLVCGCVRPRAQRQIHSFRGPLIRCKQRNPLPAVAELGPRARRRRRCCWRNTKKQHRENNKRVAGGNRYLRRLWGALKSSFLCSKKDAGLVCPWVGMQRSLARSLAQCLHSAVEQDWRLDYCIHVYWLSGPSLFALVITLISLCPTAHQSFAIKMWNSHLSMNILLGFTTWLIAWVKFDTCISNATKGMSTKPVGMCVQK